MPFHAATNDSLQFFIAATITFIAALRTTDSKLHNHVRTGFKTDSILSAIVDMTSISGGRMICIRLISASTIGIITDKSWVTGSKI